MMKWKDCPNIKKLSSLGYFDDTLAKIKEEN